MMDGLMMIPNVIFPDNI